MFDFKTLPSLIRRDIEYVETHVPEVPDDVPEVVAADPSWTRQWLNVKAFLEAKTFESVETWDAKRKRTLGRYWAVTGLSEFELIVMGCTYAATHFEMPTAWRTCLVKQAYDDMEHSASYITRGCRLTGENYWEGIDLPYRENVEAHYPILRRDLGGFFAVIGIHAEAYLAETNILEALALDPVLARWFPREIEEEASHLAFLFPAMHDYLNSGPTEEQDRKKRQMVADNEILLETMLEANRRNAEAFLVNRLGLDASVMQAFAQIPQRTRFIFNRIGIEASYWPSYLRI